MGRNNLTVLAYLFRPGSAGSLCGYGSRFLGWNTQCSLFRPIMAARRAKLLKEDL